MKAAAIPATAYLNLNLNYENLLFSGAKVQKIIDIHKKNLGKDLGKDLGKWTGLTRRLSMR